MYRPNRITRSGMTSVVTVEGETLEQKIERIVQNSEPITDGAPEVFTERKDGVLSAYNIRTDRWEIACEAMDTVTGVMNAKRDGIGKVIPINGEKEDGEAKTVDGGTATVNVAEK
jgi:hypothetical protein